jgi:hypothetical protein
MIKVNFPENIRKKKKTWRKQDGSKMAGEG